MVACSFRPRYNATLLNNPFGMSLMLPVAGDTTVIMEVIVQRDQSQAITTSLKWRLTFQAILQWLIAILLWRLGNAAPIGYPLPQWLAHLLMLLLAIMLTLLSLSAWHVIPVQVAVATRA